jgi:hypothetical protein
MDKVKVALTLLSIAIVVGPLGFMVYEYRDNLLGIFIPPEFQSLLGGSGSNSQQSSSTSNIAKSLSNFQMPQAIGSPAYNTTTGAFNYPFNFTNPFDFPVALNQFSAEVVGPNNETLGNVAIQPINIGAGQNAVINVAGNLSQSAVNQLESEFQSGNLNVSLKNVTVNVAGITVNIPSLSNIGSLTNTG